MPAFKTFKTSSCCQIEVNEPSGLPLQVESIDLNFLTLLEFFSVFSLNCSSLNEVNNLLNFLQEKVLGLQNVIRFNCALMEEMIPPTIVIRDKVTIHDS